MQAISADGRTRHAQQRAAVRPPGRARSERRARLPAARRQPHAQRHHPLGERDRHARPHDRDAHGRRRHPLRALQGPRAHDVPAAEHHDQPHRPLPDPHASPRAVRCRRRPTATSSRWSATPWTAARPRRKFKWGIAVHGSHYGLIQDNVVYNYNGAVDRDRRRVGELQRLRPQLRAARHRRAQRLGVRSAHGDGHRGRRLLVPRAEQLRPQQRRRQLPEPDDRSGVRVRLPVALPGQHRGAELQGRRPGRRPASSRRGTATTCRSCSSRTTKRTAPCRADSRYWWVSSQDPQPCGQRAGEPDQGSEALEHLQQDRLHVSEPEDHLRRLEDPRQLQLGEPLLRQRRLLRGLLVEGHRHPQLRHPGHGGGHHRARGRLRPGAEPHRSRTRTCATDVNIDVPTNGSVNGCWMDNKLVVDQQHAVRRAAGPQPQRDRRWSATSRTRPSA